MAIRHLIAIRLHARARIRRAPHTKSAALHSVRRLTDLPACEIGVCATLKRW